MSHLLDVIITELQIKAQHIMCTELFTDLLETY